MTMLRAAVLVGVFALSPALAFAQQPCTSDARQVVDAIYQQVLERSPDAGAQGWIDRLSGGQASVRDLVREIAKSNEHVQRFLSTSNRDAQQQSVTYLYRHLLGRQPDASGANTYLGIVSSQGVQTAVDRLMASSEYQQNFGTSTVPGRNVRYCGPGEQSVATTGSTGAIRFRGMDSNNDGRIARNEWRGSDQSFNVHDWNNDGVLSGDEVRPGGRRATNSENEDFSASNTRFQNWTEAGFRNLDHNGDGVVSSREWHYDFEGFSRADRNRDGILSRQEFLSTDMDDDRDDQFQFLDANRNGRVEKSEWHGSADAFDWLDRNRDGVLSRVEVVGNRARNEDEFASLDVDNDRRLSRDEWHWSRRSFDQRDTNGDGLLTRREFDSGGAVPTTGR
jgi:Ca2+-binding EF-hand superfamily protein